MLVLVSCCLLQDTLVGGGQNLCFFKNTFLGGLFCIISRSFPIQTLLGHKKFLIYISMLLLNLFCMYTLNSPSGSVCPKLSKKTLALALVVVALLNPY